MTTGKKTIVAAALGVVTLGAGLGVTGLASADPTPSTPTTSPTASPSGSDGTKPDGRGGPGRGPHGPGRDAIAAERAAGLETRLDDAVQTGTLTQAEADAVTKAVEQGVIPGGR